MRRLFFFLAALPISVTAQSITDSILVEGHYRTFNFTKPATARNDASLLFIMHGSGGSAQDVIKHAAKLEAASAKENLLLVYPEGYKRYWNECRKYAKSDANKEDINEEAFFSAMIDYFHNRYGISTEKVFATGFSGGGHMSYKLGLTMPGTIKAIAAVVASLPDSASSDCSTSGQALPVLIINGTLDNINPYTGGEMFINKESFGVVRSAENTLAYWAGLAGYQGEPVKETLADTDPNDQRIIESYTYSAKQKPTVRLLKVVGGKHDYPNDIDVYSYIWEFFKSQSATLTP